MNRKAPIHTEKHHLHKTPYSGLTRKKDVKGMLNVMTNVYHLGSTNQNIEWKARFMAQ